MWVVAPRPDWKFTADAAAQIYMYVQFVYVPVSSGCRPIYWSPGRLVRVPVTDEDKSFFIK